MYLGTIRPATDVGEVHVEILPEGCLPACTSTGHPFRVPARGNLVAEFSGDPDDEIICTPKEWVG